MFLNNVTAKLSVIYFLSLLSNCLKRCEAASVGSTCTLSSLPLNTPVSVSSRASLALAHFSLSSFRRLKLPS